MHSRYIDALIQDDRNRCQAQIELVTLCYIYQSDKTEPLSDPSKSIKLRGDSQMLNKIAVQEHYEEVEIMYRPKTVMCCSARSHPVIRTACTYHQNQTWHVLQTKLMIQT